MNRDTYWNALRDTTTRPKDPAVVVADLRRAAAATGNRRAIEDVESAILAVYPDHARYISRTARYAPAPALEEEP